MAGTGRKPYTTTDAVPWHLGNQRLKPPKTLGDLEKQAFIDLISRVPLTQFQECDLSLICRWCELEVMAQQAAGEMHAQGMVTADGKVSPWFTVHQQATKGQALLALRLRLGPQSRSQRAPKTQPAPMSYYERASLLESDDETEPS